VLNCLGGDQLRKLGLSGCEDVDPLVELFPIKRLKIPSLSRCTLTPIAKQWLLSLNASLTRILLIMETDF
jgi:hypothetical protein